MLKTVLVPLDGSPLAKQAVPYAVRLIRTTGAKLVLFRASTAEPRAEVANALHDELASLGREIQRDGAVVETRVAFDLPHAAILAAAREAQADLIVMSTHGRSGIGRWISGSVADQVMRHADVPVLLVPAARSQAWPEDRALRVLVPLDGSALAAEALGPAQELAQATAAEVLLMHAVDSPAYRYTDAYPYTLYALDARLREAREGLEPVASELRARGLTVHVHASTGSPATAIVDLARERGADAIVMATHGSGGLTRLLMGSVATGTIERANVPVLVVRSGAALGSRSASEAQAELVG